MKNLKQYYKDLGKVVYAVAMADGVITTAEKEALHSSVCKDLALYEHSEDSSDMNNAFYVDFEFEAAEEGHPDTSSAIKSFGKFIHGNFEAGDEKLIQHSIKVLEKVAGAYCNSKQKDLINEIKAEINEISKQILTTN